MYSSKGDSKFMIRTGVWMLTLWLSLTGMAWSEEGLKVVCACRTEKPLVIDGVLDEAAWQKAEVRSDFTAPGSGQVLNRQTTMRVLYDQDYLYFGFEVFWDDVELLKKGVVGIKDKDKDIKEGAWMKRSNVPYENIYGLEVFLDAGASGRNYYQMLFNAAGQCVGNYKCLFDCFNIEPKVKGVVRGNCWSVEMAYPARGLKAGQEWGLNVCRNDETYYGIWKQVGGAYHNPKLFGRLVIGDYGEWWDAVGGKGAREKLDTIRSQCARYEKNDSSFKEMVNDVDVELWALGKWVDQYPPVNRENFERLFERYTGCRDKLERLRVYHDTLQLITTKR